MPMHYPPLANGTYRYGDAPRPLPSPEPGPDPFAPSIPPPNSQHPGFSPPNSPPAHQPGDPGGGPPPEVPIGKTRSTGAIAAIAVIGGLALVVVAVLGINIVGPGADRGPTTDTLRGPFPQSDPLPERSPGTGVFTVDGTFTVVDAPGEPVSGDRTGCDLPVSLSDIGEGTSLTLIDAPTGRSITSRLVYEGGDSASCSFSFEFPDVTPGGSTYMIELPGRGRLPYSEEELRAGVDISLGR